jgi:hypothetical protein
MTNKLRYSQFEDRIDLDAFEEAIGFSPFAQERGNDIGHCLFPDNHKHGDTTGKFAIHRESRLYNCFVCGGGNLLSLVMELYDYDVDQATEWIHQFATGADTRSDDEFAEYLIALLEDVEKRVTSIPYFNPRVLERFDGPTDYFRSRGISDEVIERYGLRYSDEVLKPAPTKVGRDGQRIKIDDDYIGPASIWPHFWQGRLVGWQYRWHDFDKDHAKTPKWLGKWTNTTDFPRNETLFNYDTAVKYEEPVIVTESLGTTLFLESLSIPAIAYFGSKLHDEQLRLLRRFGHGVILAPDNDSNRAGDRVLGAARYLERFVPVWVLDKIPPAEVGMEKDADGIDLGDFAYTSDPEGNVRNWIDHHRTQQDIVFALTL